LILVVLVIIPVIRIIIHLLQHFFWKFLGLNGYFVGFMRLLFLRNLVDLMSSLLNDITGLIVLLHHVLNLALSHLQELFRLESCLDLVHRLLLHSCGLKSSSFVLIAARLVQEVTHSCQTLQNVLDVGVVLLLDNYLVLEFGGLLDEQVLVLVITIFIVSIHTRRLELLAVLSSLVFPDSERVVDELLSIFPELLLLPQSSLLRSD
jgi:hypothetical protein